jgi:TP901 family phage tail tape measure protein
MAGPTLELGVSSSGLSSLERMNAEVKGLIGNLRLLPEAATNLQKLQAQLDKVTAPKGLKGAGAELSALAREIKVGNQAIVTSLAEMTEAIKKGYAAAAMAKERGEAQVSAKGAKGMMIKSIGADGKPTDVPLAWFAKMQTGALGFEEAARRQAAALEASHIKLQTASATWAEKYRVAEERRRNAVEQAHVRMQVTSANWAEKVREADAKRAAALEQSHVKMQVTSATWAEKAREAEAKRAAALEASHVKMQVTSATWAEKAREADVKRAAALEQSHIKMQVTSANWAEKFREAEAKRAAALDAAHTKMQVTSATWAEKFREAEAKRAAALEQSRVNMQVNSAKWAESAREEAARIAQAMKIRNAAYMAASEASRSRSVLGARSQLDAGIDPNVVRQNFGQMAFGAAQATTLAQAYGRVHQEAGAAVPKLTSFSRAMGDAHSAMRGMASGFGAMWLTWGNLAPLMAGAALSHSFVQSIKIGAQARQELETLRVLSEESRYAVSQLEAQMISLGERGPFGPVQITEAMKTLSLAGLKATEVADALKPALNLALTGNVDIQKSAESLVAIGTAYGYQAEQFDRVGDIVAKAAAVSMSSVDGMMESFRSSSVVAQQYKVSLEDTATALALLANVGIQRSAAGTSVRQMFSELSGASRSTRAAMADLGVKIIETDKNAENVGGFRSLLDIVRDLDKALSTKSPEAYQRAIQDISNERGAKSVVALLEALKKKVQKEGGDVQSELDRINELIKKSFGFTAIAAAQMAGTPINQMKSVVSSFQTALFNAFTQMEPALLVIAERLRNAFNSDEFRSTVASLATSVADLTVFLIEHADIIKKVAIAYALWKGTMIGVGLFTGLATAITALGGAWRALAAAQTGAAAAATAAAGAQVAAGGAAAAGTAAMAARVGLLSRLAAFLPGIGAAVGIAGTAWAMYELTSNKANVTEAQGVGLRQGAVIQALDAELGRLTKLEAELKKGTAARLADMRVQEMAAKAGRNTEFDKLNAPKKQQLSDAQVKVDSMLHTDPSLKGLLDGTRQPTKQSGGLLMGNTAQNQRAKRDAEFLAAVKTQNELRTQWEAAGREFFQNEAKIDQLGAAVQAAAERVSKLQDKQARSFGTDPIKDNSPQAKAAAEAAARAMQQQDEDILSALKSRYTKQESTIKAFYDQERKEVETKNKYKLISEAEYLNEVDRLAAEQYESEKANLEKFVDETKAILQQLRALKKPSAAEIRTTTEIEQERRQAQDQLVARQRLIDIEAAGRANRSDGKLNADLATLRDRLNLEAKQVDLAERMRDIEPKITAALQARTQVEAQYTEILRDKNAELALAEERLYLIASAESRDPRAYQEQLNLEDDVARLRAQRDRIVAEGATQADRASRLVFVGMAEGFESESEKILRGWRDLMGTMRSAYVDHMQRMHSAGMGIWSNFLKTGKLNLRSLVEAATETFAELSYKRVAAPFVENIGNEFFGLFEAAFGVPATHSNTSPEGRAAQAMDQLQAAGFSAADALNMVAMAAGGTQMGPMGSYRDNPFQAVDDGTGVTPEMESSYARMRSSTHEATNALRGLGVSVRGVNLPVGNLISSMFGLDRSVDGVSRSFPQHLNQLLSGIGDGFNQMMRNMALSISASSGTGSGIGSFLTGLIGGIGGTGGGTGFLSGGAGGMGPSTVGMSQALGGAWAYGVKRFGRGGAFTNKVYSQPTLFSFANGAAVGEMGEAGPEAIMPLTRGPGGGLGVKSYGGGGGGKTVININNSGPPLQVKEQGRRETSDGGMQIDLMVEQIEQRLASRVANGNGPMTSAMSKRFGLNPAMGAPLQRPG